MSVKKPVGPVDVAAFLADRAAGVKPPRTASCQVFLSPELAAKYDELADRFNALLVESEPAAGAEVSIGDGPDDNSAELDAVEAEMDAVLAQADASKVTLTFRSYRLGDLHEIETVVKARGVDTGDYERLSAISTAHYLVDPVLDVEQVIELIDAIGWAQFNQVCACWQELINGVPTGPKLRKPLRTRGTPTL